MAAKPDLPYPDLSGFQQAVSDEERLSWFQQHLDTLSPEALDWLANNLWLFNDRLAKQEAFRWLLPKLDQSQVQHQRERLADLPLYEQLPLLALLLPHLPEDEQPALCEQLVQEFDSSYSGPELVDLVQQVAAYLPESLHRRAVEALAKQSDEMTRVKAWAALAQVLEPGLRSQVVEEALSLARRLTAPWERASALTALARVLPERLQQEVIAEALQVAQEEAEPGNRVWLLTELLPLLNDSMAEDVVGHILSALDSIPDDLHRAEYFAQVAELLPASALEHLDSIAGSIENPEARAKAYLALENVQQQAKWEQKTEAKESAVKPEPEAPSADETATSSAYQAVPTHLDRPADLDRLNRRPFAEVIAVSMRHAYRQMNQNRKAAGGHQGNGDAFMVHLHGQWGAGKSSVLNFLGKCLTETSSDEDPAWLVITFNAWRHQHLGPPWWALINAFYDQSRQQLQTLDKPARRRLDSLQWRWRLRTRLGPVVLTAALALWGLSLAFGQSETDIAGTVKRLLEVTAVILGVSATLMGGFRSLFLGSAQTAKLYTELSRDPMRPILKYYQQLVSACDRPIAIFIDDLDRCDSEYVVSLLSGIQTMFRRSDVSYVVAADRNWLRSCYEKSYQDFSHNIGEPGRPLGYLFLEKVFQVSVGLPRLSAHAQNRYLSTLLAMDEAEPDSAVAERERQAEHQASAELKTTVSEAEFSERIAQSRHDPMRQRAMRVAAAKRMLTPEVQRHTEHALQPYANLLEPNPRAMKRLVNAFGFQQAVNWLSERDVPQHPLVLWTLIQMRWPLLADTLARFPDTLDSIGSDALPAQVPANLRELFSSAEVLAVVQGQQTSPDKGRLTPQQIRRIVGTEMMETDSGVR